MANSEFHVTAQLSMPKANGRWGDLSWALGRLLGPSEGSYEVTGKAEPSGNTGVDGELSVPMRARPKLLRKSWTLRIHLCTANTLCTTSYTVISCSHTLWTPRSTSNIFACFCFSQKVTAVL